MGIPTKTLDVVLRRGVANFRTSFPGFPLGTKKFLGRSARAVGLQVWGLQKSVEDVSQDIVPSSQTSTDTLSEWAALLGLPDGQGGYGRLLPTEASGGQASLTGVKGTIYPINSVATAEDGTTQIKLLASVTIPGSAPGFGSITGLFVAVTAGSVGNLAAGTVCTWQSAPSGSDQSFTLTSALGDGIDTEDNPSVYARIVERLQNPPRGGVEEDYRLWATVSGVVRVFVYPKRSGTGSVDLVITTGGTGQSRIPSVTSQTLAEASILAKRPAAVDGVDVLLPYMPNSSGHLVRVRVTASKAKYAFDWDDTSGPFTVDTYAAGPPATLKLNVLAPASLKGAIDAYKAGNGQKPRLQVISTGVVINPSIGCVDWSDGGGKTTLTLDTVPSTWTAPTASDAVYAYGPAVATIAAGIVALCDSLGPSRVSGFADAKSPWSDKLTISGIIRIAEDAIDTDGSKLIGEVQPGLATIDGTVADVEGGDSTGAPEIIYLSHVIVTA